ncbi:hypothetical protein BDF21DRAFT_368756 [Thamnidium elegans]|uniref:BZIP domain-containing protein n=1 Tax=Thamnidium elegans TaxID=101142 RepID=A0A8H7VYG2_9FUNG|nr:hypothetical protein INT48_007754 [Thamnidium elegans]KAI8064075.1 hypothetical protein BDF21DRAFT_368756 [Thamnidium elegans]
MTSTVEKEVKEKTPDNSPPMAVLPLNSSTKLDQEPNPFEQSFSGASVEDKANSIKLPPVASITSPAVKAASVVPVIGGGILPKEVSNQFNWDTLRTGPLSPSMLQGPAKTEEYYQKGQLAPPSNYSARSSFSSSTDIQYMQQQPQQHHQQQHQQVKTEHDVYSHRMHHQRQQKRKQSEDNHSIDSNHSSVQKKSRRTRRRSSMLDDEDDDSKNRSRASSSKEPEDDEKRKNFLERNRIAALKCRQRKKQWLNNLQAKVEFLSSDNERLQVQSDSLKEEIVNLKTLLLAHKECPVAQSNGFHASAIQKAMPTMLTQQHMMNRSSPMVNPYSRPPAPTVPPPPLPSSQQQQLPPTSQPASSSSAPRFQRANMVGLPTQGQQESNNNQGMITSSGTGGTSSVLRF